MASPASASGAEASTAPMTPARKSTLSLPMMRIGT